MKVFISYAHADEPYFKVFEQTLKTQLKSNKKLSPSVWEDGQIYIGSLWDDEIQKQLAECDLAILCISDNFLASDYIKAKEFGVLIKQFSQTVLAPMLLAPCNYKDWDELAARQIFMPKGDKYDEATNDDFTFSDLVRFNKKDGNVIPNPNISRYVKDFIAKIESALTPWPKIIEKEKVERTGRLDLGECGLTYIPDEITEMDWLEALILGNAGGSEYFFRYLKNEKNYYDLVFNNNTGFTKNNYEPNLLTNANFSGLKKLTKLQYINLNACGGPIRVFDLFLIPSLEVLILTDNDFSTIKSDRPSRFGENTKVKKIANKLPSSKLKVLDISGSNESQIILNVLGKEGFFRHITHLGLSRVKLESLNELTYWESLISLDMGGNHGLKSIQSFPPFLNLEHLFLDASSLFEIDGVASFPKLRTLSASSNAISDITNLQENKNLTNLNLAQNNIESVEVLKYLANIHELDISKNKIIDIKALADLKELTHLDISKNSVTSLEPLSFLPKLESLVFNDNLVEDISVIKNVLTLKTIKASSNKIKSADAINQLINSLTNLISISISGNPLENIPKEIINSTSNMLPALVSYFDGLLKGSTINNEVKLVLVGNSTAGKTTLRKILQGKNYNSKEDSTHGIVADTWVLKENDLMGITDLSELKVHIWDFGGQEYYHETHRLFFSQHALYIIVWEQATNKHEIIATKVNENENGKTDQKEKYIEHQTYEYWLKNIRHYSPDSSIILVQNKVDLQYDLKTEEEEKNPDEIRKPFRLKKADDLILNKYNVEQAFDISLKKFSVDKDPDYEFDYKKFDRFLKKELALKASYFKLGKSYNEIKKKILNLRKKFNTISKPEYERLCRSTDKDAHIQHLTDYLSNTSILNYYDKNPKLADTVFINPVWISDTIYKILDKTVLNNSGLFSIESVRTVLNNEEKIADEMIELMKEFQIIFEKVEKNKITTNFIAPQYLPEGYTSRSYYLFRNQCGAPRFIMRFPRFLPRTIMNRVLSLYAGRAVDGNCYYKYGVAFEEALTSGATTNIIECDYDNSEIHVFSTSSDLQNLRTIFQTLLTLFDIDISDNNLLLTETQMLDNVLKSSATIYLSVDGQNYINWNLLFAQRASVENDTLILPEQGIQVRSELFNPFFLSKDRFISYLSLRRDTIEPPKVFISYAHEDEQYKDELLEHLSGLKNEGIIKEWTDRAIRPGEKWDDSIKKSLQEANIILFLISSSFMASRYINNVELKISMQRSDKGETTVIPVHIRPCDYKSLPLKTFQKIPRDAPIVDARVFPTRDFAWEQVVKELKEEIKKLQTLRPATPQ